MTHGRRMPASCAVPASAEAVTSLCRAQIHLHCCTPCVVYDDEQYYLESAGCWSVSHPRQETHTAQLLPLSIVVDPVPEVHYNLSKLNQATRCPGAMWRLEDQRWCIGSQGTVMLYACSGYTRHKLAGALECECWWWFAGYLKTTHQFCTTSTKY